MSDPLVELAVRAGVTYDAVQMAGSTVYWIQGRPDGSDTLMAWDPEQGTRDILPSGMSVASYVHEYGGGAYLATSAGVWFCNAADQRVYRLGEPDTATPLTPELATSGSVRYADLRLNPASGHLLAVREQHAEDAVRNDLVAIPAEAPGAPQVVAAGWDFYSFPRPSNDGTQVAWTCWNAPDMPWDSTSLYLAGLDPQARTGEPRHVAGGPEESVFQPEWSPGGVLHFVSDRSGWWKLYAWRDGAVVPVVEERAELGVAQWEFGYSTYTFLGPDRIALIAQHGGRQHLQLLEHGKRRTIELPYTSIKPYLAGHGSTLAVIASSPTSTPGIVLVDVDTGQHQRLAGDTTDDARAVSSPERFSFRTRDGQHAHGLYYAPCSTARTEAPPLIVKAHPGPTSNFPERLDWHTQLLVSRGYAVAEVDYRGSTGYGRAYRNALRGHWGHLDAYDCADAATHLAATGHAHPRHITIWGASAGGYTALRAFALTNTFQAAIAVGPVIDPTSWQAAAPKFQAHHPKTLTGPTPPPAPLTRSDLEADAQPQGKRVLIIHGDNDPITPAQASHELADALGPAATLVTIPGGGHTMKSARAARQSIDAQLNFLEEK